MGIDVAMFYLSDSQDWLESLPADTRKELKKGPKGAFANFPYYHTMGQNALIRRGRSRKEGLVTTSLMDLTAEQVNLLSHLTSWAVERNKDLLSVGEGNFVDSEDSEDLDHSYI